MPDVITSKGTCITCKEIFFYEVLRDSWEIEQACSQTCWDYYFLGKEEVGGVSREDVNSDILETRSP